MDVGPLAAVIAASAVCILILLETSDERKHRKEKEFLEKRIREQLARETAERAAEAARAAHAKEEAATFRYLRIHTRACPKCKAKISKDGGCDHMLCRCGKSFNWSEAA